MKVFLKPKSGLLKRNPYFLDLWYGFKKTVKKLNIHHYDDFLKWKFDHVDHGRSNTVVVWFWYLPDFFVLSTGFTLNNFFFFVKPVRGFKIFFFREILRPWHFFLIKVNLASICGPTICRLFDCNMAADCRPIHWSDSF